jgi:alpha-tubulin suppressor-like RCC1 family protein
VCGEGALNAIWFCWGKNFFGQLTNGTTIEEIFPVPMNLKDLHLRLTGLSVSDNVSCGVGPAHLEPSDRTQIYCWGQPVAAAGPTRSDYQYPDILSPVDPETSDWRCDFSVVPCPAYYAVAVGERHACGLYQAINAAQGRVESVVCWGDNSMQQIGRPPAIISRNTAGLVYQAAVPPNVSRALLAIVSMKNSSCVLDQGALFCWGDFFGATPTRVLPNVLLGMIAGSREGDQVCGVGVSDDKAYCVATSSGATIPTSDLAEDGTQLRFASIMTAGEVILGTDHFCGITRVEGAMYCWGANTFGQLGQDTRGVRVVAPVKVQTPVLE